MKKGIGICLILFCSTVNADYLDSYANTIGWMFESALDMANGHFYAHRAQSYAPGSSARRTNTKSTLNYANQVITDTGNAYSWTIDAYNLDTAPGTCSVALIEVVLMAHDNAVTLRNHIRRWRSNPNSVPRSAFGNARNIDVANTLSLPLAGGAILGLDC